MGCWWTSWSALLSDRDPADDGTKLVACPTYALASMDPVVADLAAQHRELAGLLGGLPDAGWRAQTRCEGWDVADVVLHLAQTDEMAVGSATGRFESVVAEMAGGR